MLPGTGATVAARSPSRSATETGAAAGSALRLGTRVTVFMVDGVRYADAGATEAQTLGVGYRDGCRLPASAG